MAEHPVTVRFGIVCDQVRREDNGKFLIIGTYAHNIGVTTLPATIAFTLVIGMWSREAITDHPIEIRTVFNGEQVHSGKGSISINEAGSDFIVVPNILVSADKEGELEFKAKIGNDRWKVITAIPLRRRT